MTGQGISVSARVQAIQPIPPEAPSSGIDPIRVEWAPPDAIHAAGENFQKARPTRAPRLVPDGDLRSPSPRKGPAACLLDNVVFLSGWYRAKSVPVEAWKR
jgi:hypothetical protein